LKEEDVGKASMVTYDLTKLASNAVLFTCGIAAQCMFSSKPWTQTKDLSQRGSSSAGELKAYFG
jgi:uroporphyrinogen-III synthase